MTQLTTLIPAYKKEFLGEAFQGLARQSFRDFRVILSDDSPDGEITQLLRGGHFDSCTKNLNLTVVRGPGNARRNHEQLLDLWAGRTPLVHIHLDDDVIFPDFYRSHVEVHARGRYCASVSPRWLSHADGQPAWSLPLPDFINSADRRVVEVRAEPLFASTVAVCANWLGELSNMVLSAEGARCYPRPPRDELNYYGLLDIGTLLEGVKIAPIAFIRDHLSVFRQHPQQTTHNTRSHGGRIAFMAWVAYALAAWREQRITSQQAVGAIGVASQRCLQHLGEDPVIAAMLTLFQDHGASLDSFHLAFRAFWLGLLASHPATAPSPLEASPANAHAAVA